MVKASLELGFELERHRTWSPNQYAAIINISQKKATYLVYQCLVGFLTNGMPLLDMLNEYTCYGNSILMISKSLV